MAGKMDANPHIDFELIVEQNKGIIYKVANSYCKDLDDRKDLVQEIVIQLWRSLKTFDNANKLSTWMYRVALNVAISFYRRDTKRKNISAELTDKIIEIIPDNATDETEGKINQLQQFISELGHIDRALMILYLEDKSQKEIGEILGLTETNVSTKIARIKEKLKIKFSLTNE
jgi:RNA polymerase sigma-70 factor (ECF subfamily)